MTASIFIPPKVQYMDGSGNPIVGGHVYTYINHTSTPKASYTDYTATVENTNPVILDSDGRASIWLTGAYRIRVTDADDDPIYTFDDVLSYTSYDLTGLTATVDDLNSTTTTGILISTDYTVEFTDRGKTVLANAASADVEVTLPDITDVPNKWKVCIKKIDLTGNEVSIITDQPIDGVASFKLHDYGDFVEVLADGNVWRVVSSQQRGAFIDITGDLTIDMSHNGKTIFCDTSTNPITITLPAISTIGGGFTVTFKTGAVSGNHVVINASAPATIDGDSSVTLNEGYESITIKANVTRNTWYVMDSHMSNSFVTGDVKQSYEVSQSGWALYGTDGWDIGDATSGAHYAGQTFHNLFIMLYGAQDNTKCPVSGGRGSSAEDDWDAHKKLTLPKVGGRTFGTVGTGTGITARALGDNVGEENHALSWSEVGTHYHDPAAKFLSGDYAGKALASSGNLFTGSGAGNGFNPDTSSTLRTEETGSSTPHNTMQPTHFLYSFIKL